MKKISLLLPMVMLAILPLAASAHERDTFNIGTSSYQFVIGSLGEPIVVDDKTGLDLTVSKCYTEACTPTRGKDGDMDGPAGTPVLGLDSTLKVEMSAGNQKKTMDISPVPGTDGAYKTTFYPTIATTFSYRLFGTLNGAPIDLTFTCTPDGTPKTADDTSSVMLAQGVIRTSHGGAFSCPISKDNLAFPQVAPSASALNAKIDSVSAAAKSTKTTAVAAIAIGAVALALTLWTQRRKK